MSSPISQTPGVTTFDLVFLPQPGNDAIGTSSYIMSEDIVSYLEHGACVKVRFIVAQMSTAMV